MNTPGIDNNREPEAAAPAYPNNNFRRLWTVIAAIVAVFMLRNMLFTDYNQETRSYLKSIGKTEAADQIVPKTRREMIQEKLTKDVQFAELLRNMTQLTSDVQKLKSEVSRLRNNQV